MAEETFHHLETFLQTLADPSETIRPSLSANTGAEEQVADWLADLAGPALSAEQALEWRERLGEGGMGQVFAAVQKGLDRSVAVKSLKEEHRRHPGAMRRLLREARITGQLAHPNILTVHALALDADGVPHVVLERIDGVEWGKLLSDPHALREAGGHGDPLRFHLGVLIDVCNALAYAHDRGVVHRDVKPDNVMVGSFGEVYLLDWGIAVELDGDTPKMAGTPRYMAPEMLLGQAITPRTDVYLLGAVLYELLAGHAPHQGADSETLSNSIARFVPELPDAPAELAHLCRRAMAVDPARRCGSAAEFRHALTAFLDHRGSAFVAARATEQADELEALLGADELDVQAISACYAAARFGYLQALEDWPDNQPAQQSLTALRTRMVRFHLDQGDDRAAWVVLGEMPVPPPQLVSEAEDTAQARLAEATRLRALEADQDPSRGQRTRVFLGAVLGVFWTVTPWTAHYWPWWATYDGLLAIALLIGVLTAGLAFWARDSMSKSVINRTFVRQSLAVPVGMVVLQVGCRILGLPSEQCAALHLLLFSTMMTMAASIQAPLLLPAIGYAVAFVIAAMHPEYTVALLSASNLLLTATFLLGWLPGLEEQGVFKKKEP